VWEYIVLQNRGFVLAGTILILGNQMREREREREREEYEYVDELLITLVIYHIYSLCRSCVYRAPL